MLIAVIPVKDYHSAKQQLHLALPYADGIELRLDYLTILDFNAIAGLRNACHLPMIFTLRKKSQGGFYQKEEIQRLKDILILCQLNPDYIDLEYDIAQHFLKEIQLLYPHIQLICSYHDFSQTPLDLLAIFESIQNPCFYGYKLCTMAHHTVDALRMLTLVHTRHKKHILTGICMGEAGQSTRILSPIIGNAMQYASLEDCQSTAPGQLTLHELLSIYHVPKLNAASKIYALLGDPIDLSLGHILHNQAIEFLDKNAVYIKLRATQEELPDLIALCRRLPFAGFSITMPLKDAIVPLLDDIEYASQSIKAINTVVIDEEKLIGFNTDGIGAMCALSERVDISKQKIVILGAGGAAQAIAYEALQHQAEVIILNRTITKAKQWADLLGCESDDLKRLAHLKKIHYTLLINTLPECVYCQESTKEWFHPRHIRPHIWAMDIVYQPTHTSFLKMTQRAHCIGILGYEMYIHQALMQIKRWFQPNEKQLNTIKNKMNRYFLATVTSDYIQGQI
jgi:3-dehydroquinate dehydratase/shikimate dehydrogenase